MIKSKHIFISDSHMGCKYNNSEKLFNFLKNIECENLYLVGDIIDLWHKINFTKTELKILRRILKLANDGVKVTWIIGNHDSQLEFLIGEKINNIEFCKEKILNIGDYKVLITHGDLFDSWLSKNKKFLSVIGSFGYAFLLRFNSLSKKIFKHKKSISQLIKKRVKNASFYIDNFENLVAAYAKEKGCGVVIVGHIHTAKIRNFDSVLYVNCGDWQESSDYVIFDEKKLFLKNYK